MMSDMLKSLALIAALTFGEAATARDHYVAAPGDATIGQADGSPAAPWATVSTALAQVQGGDRVLLASGQHGRLVITGRRFNPPVTVMSAGKDRAHVSDLRVEHSRGLVIQGLDVWPLLPSKRSRTLVVVDAESADVRIDRLDVRGGPDALNYYDWTERDWLETWRFNGVQLKGNDIVLSNSVFTGVANGISVNGARARVVNNVVQGFSKDGMRGFGHGALFLRNTVRDCIKVDANHDDGFQSWARHGKAPDQIIDMTLDSNQILEWTGSSVHPLRCKLQGIGMFDGPYRNLLIQNNLIVVSSHHGISLHDTFGSRVLNNTVIHKDPGETRRSRISQRRYLGLKGARNVFANNLATAMQLGKFGDADLGNRIIKNPAQVFIDPSRFDFRLREDSPLRDTGDPDNSPSHDLTGATRPQGAGPDPGAYES